MTARFEIVRTDAPQPWHARFRAANGRVVWTTENYSRRQSAEIAIRSLLGWAIIVRSEHSEYVPDHSVACNGEQLEVRYVDERSAS